MHLPLWIPVSLPFFGNLSHFWNYFKYYFILSIILLDSCRCPFFGNLSHFLELFYVLSNCNPLVL